MKTILSNLSPIKIEAKIFLSPTPYGHPLRRLKTLKGLTSDGIYHGHKAHMLVFGVSSIVKIVLISKTPSLGGYQWWNFSWA